MKTLSTAITAAQQDDFRATRALLREAGLMPEDPGLHLGHTLVARDEGGAVMGTISVVCPTRERRKGP